MKAIPVVIVAAQVVGSSIMQSCIGQRLVCWRNLARLYNFIFEFLVYVKGSPSYCAVLSCSATIDMTSACSLPGIGCCFFVVAASRNGVRTWRRIAVVLFLARWELADVIMVSCSKICF